MTSSNTRAMIFAPAPGHAESLPVEIWVIIMNHLHDIGDILRLAQVSKYLNECAQDPRVWRDLRISSQSRLPLSRCKVPGRTSEIDTRKLDFRKNPVPWNTLSRHLCHTHMLEVRYPVRLNESQVRSLADLTELRGLCIDDQDVDIEIVAEVLYTMKSSLTQLDIAGTNIWAQLLERILAHHPKLEGLALEYTNAVDRMRPSLLRALAMHPNLKAITLGRLTPYIPKPIALPDPPPSQVVRLDLAQAEVPASVPNGDDAGYSPLYQVLRCFPKVQQLDLEYVQVLLDEVLDLCPKLTALNLAEARIHDRDVRGVLSRMARMPSLSVLNLTHTSFEHLNLNLEGAEVALAFVTEWGESAKALSLDAWWGTQAVAEAIAAHCPNLEHLSLDTVAPNFRVATDIIITILRQCTRLQSLDIRNACMLSPQLLSALVTRGADGERAYPCGPCLKKLRVSHVKDHPNAPSDDTAAIWRLQKQLGKERPTLRLHVQTKQSRYSYG